MAGTTYLHDDDSYTQCDLGFTFPFYGTDYTTVYGDSNGRIGFTGGSYYSHGDLNTISYPNICPF